MTRGIKVPVILEKLIIPRINPFEVYHLIFKGDPRLPEVKNKDITATD